MSVAELDGLIDVIGGYPSSRITTATVQVYDPATDRWRRGDPLPVAHNHTMAASVNGVLHVAGGRPPRGSDFAVYDPSTDRWEVPAGLPTQRNHLAMVGLGGRVYVIGGRTGAVLVGGLIHLPGGGTSGGGASGSTVHQVYRPAPGQP